MQLRILLTNNTQINEICEMIEDSNSSWYQYFSNLTENLDWLINPTNSTKAVKLNIYNKG